MVFILEIIYPSILILELIGLLYMCKILNSFTYFDSFGVEHIPKEIKGFINHPLSSALQNNKYFQNTGI